MGVYGVSGSSNVSGNQSDADLIHDLYLKTREDLNAKYSEIGGLPNGGWSVEPARSAYNNIRSLVTQLESTYSANRNKTFAEFQELVAPIIEQAENDYNVAMGREASDPHAQIDKLYEEGLDAFILHTPIDQNRAQIDSLKQQVLSLEETISELEAEINDLESGDSRKTKAQSDLDSANAKLEALNSAIRDSESALAHLQEVINGVTVTGGPLDQLKALSEKEGATEEDLAAARDALNAMMADKNSEQAKVQSALTAANNSLSAVNNALNSVRNTLSQVITPPSEPPPSTAQTVDERFNEVKNDLIAKRQEIGALPNGGWTKEPAYSAYLKIDQLLGQINKDYSDNRSKTLAEFEQVMTRYVVEGQDAYDAAMGNLTPAVQMQRTYQSAQTVVSDLEAKIVADQAKITGYANQLEALRQTISDLEAEIAGLDEGELKNAAQAALSTAKSSLTTIENNISAAQTALGTLQQQLNDSRLPSGAFEKITNLASIANPTQANVDAAKAALATLQALSASEISNVQGAITTLTASIGVASRAITSVEKVLNPTAPPTIAEIEHNTWFMDWMSNDIRVPPGVNVVNISMFGFTANGDLVGFGAMNQLLDHNFPYDPETNPTKFEQFIKNCHEQGVAVKIAIGGGGGQYDNVWEQLTEANVGAFAQKLVDFCHNYGIEGIDFDCEDQQLRTNPQLRTLVGKYIAEFKKRDPSLVASLCTNSGFSTGGTYPWPDIVRDIFEGAATIDPTTGVKTYPIDRLNVMPYTRPIALELPDLLLWDQMIREEFGMSSSQLVVAMDEDFGQYKVEDFTPLIAEHGWGTGYWASDGSGARFDTLQAIESTYNAAISPELQVQRSYQDAQTLLTNLEAKIATDQAKIDSYSVQLVDFQSSIEELQAEIAALPDGDLKDAAQTALNNATASLATIENNIATAQRELDNLQRMVDDSKMPGGPLAQLTSLNQLTNPTKADVDAAKAALAAFQGVVTFESSTVQASFTTTNSSLAISSSAIRAVRTTLNPTALPSGEIEHSTWYITWNWNNTGGQIPPVPEGVTTVNIFTGGIDVNGLPYGFGGLTPLMDWTKPYDPVTNPTRTSEDLDRLIADCHAKGIDVRISLGGTGRYENLWDNLTESNVTQFAQTLVDYCHAHGIDGVDFDYEEFGGAAMETLVGKYIGEFKRLDPNLTATLCTNAGFEAWSPAIKRILDAASSIDPVTGKKVAPIDRLNIMSYTRPAEQEEIDIDKWATFIEGYSMHPSNICVGIDDYDLHNYDIGEFAAWAGEKGYSTAYWGWDPATKDSGNNSANEIDDSYSRLSPD